MDTFQEIIDSLNELLEDTSIPKNLKYKVEAIINTLKSDLDIPIKVSRALQNIEEISEEANIDQFSRTKIWDIASKLEIIC